MSFENEIPEFAMLPARDPDEQIIVPSAENVQYDSVKVTKLIEPECVIFTVEEDVLVPDTHPDMKEILMIDGCMNLDQQELETERGRKAEACGNMELQVLYIPEKNEECTPVDITAGIRFRQNVTDDSCGKGVLWMDGKVLSVESMIINERKYRVKIKAAISVSRFESWEKEIFRCIDGEEMEYLKEKVEICDASTRVKDILEISEELGQSEEGVPVKILRQDICVMENYRQATSEKVVINGFIMVNMLYCSREDDGICDDDEMTGTAVLRQLQDKVEFTQFIPLQSHEQWQASRAVYNTSDLKVKINDDETRTCPFVLEGCLETRVALIKSVEREVVVDAYHKKKDFICDYEKMDNPVHGGIASGEAGMREIISFDDGACAADGAVYVCGSVLETLCRTEGGKPVAEGTVRVKVLCQKEDSGFCTYHKDMTFRCIMSSGQIAGDESMRAEAIIKDIWAEKINSRQLEINVSMAVQAVLMKESRCSAVKKPAFRQCDDTEEGSSVIIYVARDGENVWNIAKRFKTAVSSICQANDVENDEIFAGKKLLIMR